MGAVVFLVALSAFLWGVASFASYRCAERWPGRDTQFRLVTGCMVNNEGAFVPEEAGR